MALASPAPPLDGREDLRLADFAAAVRLHVVKGGRVPMFRPDAEHDEGTTSAANRQRGAVTSKPTLNLVTDWNDQGRVQRWHRAGDVIYALFILVGRYRTFTADVGSPSPTRWRRIGSPPGLSYSRMPSPSRIGAMCRSISSISPSSRS